MVESRWAMIERRAAGHEPAQRVVDLLLDLHVDRDVASSSTRIGGFTSSVRAIAMRWRWPPESVKPRSPTTVS